MQDTSFSAIRRAASRTVSVGAQIGAGRCTRSPRCAVRTSPCACATWPVRIIRARRVEATNSPLRCGTACLAGIRISSHCSRARTVKAGACPVSIEGWPNTSPTSSTSTTSSSCTSSTEPLRTT